MVAHIKLSTKVIEKTVGEVSKQQKYTQDPSKESPFKQMLDTISSGEEFASKIGIDTQQIGLPKTGTQAISASGIEIDTANLRVGLDQPAGIEKVVGMLSEVNDGQMQMQNMVNHILYSGKKFSNQELLAIQAHVFHFAQMTELTVKIADQGIGSMKAVLNTNVQ